MQGKDCPLCKDPINIMPGPQGGPETYVILNHRLIHVTCLPPKTRKIMEARRRI